MKYFLNFFILLIVSLGACQKKNAPRQPQPEPGNYENQFFSLDFENQDTDIEEFKKHFFTTFPHNDPTQGDVIYDRAKWISDDLINLKAKRGLFTYIKYRDDKAGYDSQRLTTKAFFNLNEETRKILFVFKGSLPSAKGMWPAWWLNGSKENTWTYKDNTPALTDESLNRFSGKGNFYETPSSVNNTDWPGSGEIDIIENINGDNHIHNTIHTCPQMCDSEWNDDGITINCANTRPGTANPGCSGKLYPVNKVEGTFACLWEQESIQFYYWEPGSNVKDNGGPLSAQPNPDLWMNGPLKNTAKLLETDTKCNRVRHQAWQCKNCAESHTCNFSNMKMIFNVTLCGVWAGNKFDSTDNAFNNCKKYIMSDGKSEIDSQFMKIEYVSVSQI